MPDLQGNQDTYNAVRKDTEIFKCKSCGGNLIYSPKTGQMSCAFCGSASDFNKDPNIIPIDFFNEGNVGKPWEEATVFKCNNCGASEIISKYEIAKTCPFCGTSNIVLTNELPGIAPNAVLPFKLSIDDAKERFKKWMSHSFFAPRKLKKLVKDENVSGVYSPCFSFFTNTKSTYYGVLGKYYSNGKTSTLRTFKISGNYDMSFSDILIECGPQLTQKEIDKIKPFPTNQAYKYDLKYLAGFLATSYSKSVQASFEDAKKIMQNMLKRKILSQYSYDVVESLNINTIYNDIRFNYLLVPVYICNYQYGGKTYNFYVNGTNGKIWGKKPVSGWKIFGTIAIAAAIVAGGAVLILKLMGKI